MEKSKPEDCSRFDRCSAPLCPLDKDINLRSWYAGEDVCKAQQHNKHRWIRKQRSIVRRQTACWLDRPVTFKELYDKSRKKIMSPKQLKALRNRMTEMQLKRSLG